MHRPLLAPALALALALLAGCVTPPAADGAVESADTTAPILAALEATGEGAVGYLGSYVMTHPYRVLSYEAGGRQISIAQATGSHMAKARADLVSELEGFGLEVVLHEYSASGTNILGISRGTELPDEWIVLSAHYDTVPETVYGAWDDGAGVAMLLELARAAGETSFRRSVVFAFFDEEEQGLLGSKAFVADHMEQVTLVANLNFDPPGLNWPCQDAQGPLPVKIIFNEERIEKGLPGYAELKEAVLAGLDAAEVPEEVRDFDSGIPIATVNGIGPRGTSDHASFNAVDIPAVFIGSAPTSRAGPAAALTYALHTPIDTMAQMEARCGGADLLTKAFDVEITVTETALAILDAR